VRKQLATEIPGTLKALSSIGFDAVELEVERFEIAGKRPENRAGPSVESIDIAEARRAVEVQHCPIGSQTRGA
jgi:hypothetical protein